MTDKSKCWDSEAGEWNHRGWTDTGKRGTNPISGDKYKVMKCACGKKEWNVYPK